MVDRRELFEAIEMCLQTHTATFHSQDVTLRDQFAMHIMGGTCVDNQNNIQAWNVDKMAEWAYRAADAMLKARGGEER